LCELIEKVVERYPTLNRDWLIAGALLHDLAKIEELSEVGPTRGLTVGAIVPSGCCGQGLGVAGLRVLIADSAVLPFRGESFYLATASGLSEPRSSVPLPGAASSIIVRRTTRIRSGAHLP